MEEIIQANVVYKTNKGTPVTDSLKVAQVFGRLHKNVIRSIREIVMSANLLANHQAFCETFYQDTQGKKQPLFLMTREGFCALVMRWNGDRANQFKMAFVDLFSKMEQAIQQMQPIAPAVPQTFAKALRLAASQAEQIKAQQKQLEAQAPKVLFAQSIETSSSSILVGELAKLMKQNGVNIGEKRLFNWLRENEYLCSLGSRYNQPTQKAMNMGLFEMKKTTITTANGDIIVATTTKVTGKGQAYFINKFLYQQLPKSQTR